MIKGQGNEQEHMQLERAATFVQTPQPHFPFLSLMKARHVGIPWCYPMMFGKLSNATLFDSRVAERNKQPRKGTDYGWLDAYSRYITGL